MSCFNWRLIRHLETKPKQQTNLNANLIDFRKQVFPFRRIKCSHSCLFSWTSHLMSSLSSFTLELKLHRKSGQVWWAAPEGKIWTVWHPCGLVLKVKSKIISKHNGCMESVEQGTVCLPGNHLVLFLIAEQHKFFWWCSTPGCSSALALLRRLIFKWESGSSAVYKCPIQRGCIPTSHTVLSG